MIKEHGVGQSDYSGDAIERIVLVAVYGGSVVNGLELCQLIAPHASIHIAGIVVVPPEQPLSYGARYVSRMRKQLKEVSVTSEQVNSVSVQVSYNAYQEISDTVAQVNAGLVVLDCTEFPSLDSELVKKLLSQPPSNFALLRGPLIESIESILVPVRGGPYAELALRLALGLHRTTGGAVKVLYARPPAEEPPTAQQDRSYAAIARALRRMPAVEQINVLTTEPAPAIISEALNHDIVFMGSSGSRAPESADFGEISKTVIESLQIPLVIVKSKTAVPESYDSRTVGQQAISLLVDSWFAQNTYHSAEFTDLAMLVDLKRASGEKISVALPALNEESTIHLVISEIQKNLMEQYALVDEIIVVDSNSTDRTREIAESLGVSVHIHQEVLPQYGSRAGKGEALWKSLYLTSGDIILFVDTDIVNFSSRFVSGQIGALLSDPELQFVKGFYRRPLRVEGRLQAGGGGRVTELMARPLLNLFFPELSGIIQPLSGEYGGRRKLLEKLSFYSGYGVEIGLLIDALHECGLYGIAQVDLLERVHHNQELTALSKMSFLILQAVMDKVSKYRGVNLVEDFDRSMKIIQYVPGHLSLSVDEVAEQIRPPMIEVLEYAKRI